MQGPHVSAEAGPSATSRPATGRFQGRLWSACARGRGGSSHTLICASARTVAVLAQGDGVSSLGPRLQARPSVWPTEGLPDRMLVPGTCWIQAWLPPFRLGPRPSEPLGTASLTLPDLEPSEVTSAWRGSTAPSRGHFQNSHVGSVVGQVRLALSEDSGFTAERVLAPLKCQP